MAKRKKRKQEKEGLSYATELAGVILFVCGVVGFGNFGVVGSFIKNFAIFLSGEFYFIILALGIILGLYMILKRNAPNFLSAKLIGVYLIVLAILILAHQGYISEKTSFMEIIKNTFNSITIAFKDSASIIGNEKVIQTGGGMIGAVFAATSYIAFGKTGTYVIVAIFGLFGVIMLFSLTLSDLLKGIIKPFKGNTKLEKNEKPIISLSNNDDDEDNIASKIPVAEKKTISSIDEIKVHTPQDNESAQLEMEFKPVIHDNSQAYSLPTIDEILNKMNSSKGKVNSTEFIVSNSKTLERALNEFGIQGKVVQVYVGPAVTQYEMELVAGTRVNKVTSIDKEIALALGAKDVRIEAPIPGKHTIGIEIPNPEIASVGIREILGKVPQKYADSKLLAALGKDINGNIQFVEINKTPHLLVAGATGSGKSVCINSMIASILMRTTPNDVKLVLIDPKKVEMAVYDGIPHLLTPVITDPKKASGALQKIVMEMDRRYEVFKETGTKNISSYNEYKEEQMKKGKEVENLPYIVVIIDELADLMLVAQKEVETSIMRIAQLARACGIHLIVATQRPSADIVTGKIKANIPSRIAFAVSSQIDSRTILDSKGAEKLLGKGDMLFSMMGAITPIRIQGCFISDEEIEKLTNFWKKQSSPQYSESFDALDNVEDEKADIGSSTGKPQFKDPLYNEILDYAIKSGAISASLIQRRFSVGYNRAARIIDDFEEQGIVGPQKGSKPRDVLLKYDNEEQNNYEEE